MKRKIVILIMLAVLLCIATIVNNNTIQSYASEEGRIVEDGIYRISMFEPKSCHLSLEIENGSKKVEANVQIGTWINKDNDKNKFKVKYEEETGYYTIQSVVSGYMLDVQNGWTDPGTNVWQHIPNGTDAQKWKIIKNTDGSYSFISKKSGLYLNIENNNMNDGGNVQVSSGNGTSAQKFQLISLDSKPEKTVEDGIYEVSLKTDENMVIQVQNSSKENGGNINVGEYKRNTLNQKFQLIYNEDDGYYTIENINSEKVFDAQNGGMTGGTNVWQYKGNYTDAQRWKIEKNNDGSYSFVCKKSGLYLENKNGNIEINNKTELDNQKFYITSKNEKPVKTIENGTYRISLFENAYCHLSLEIENGAKKVEANVQIGTWINKDNDKNKFKVKYEEETGYYTIQSVASGHMLDVQNGWTDPGTNVWQHIPNGTDAQKWEIIKNTDGSYSFISKKSGLYLNVENSKMEDGANIQVFNGNGTSAQKFQLISLDSKPEKTVEDGIYEISLKTDENMVIQVQNSSKENAANVNIGENKNKKSQKFKITYNEDDGYYTIENINSGKVFDAQNGGMTDGTNIWQYSSNYTDAQRWKIEKNSDESYSFVCKKSGLYLENKNGNIEINSKTEADTQKFKIKEPVEKGIEEGTYKIVVASNQDLSIDVNNATREKTGNIVLGKTSDSIRNEFNIVSDKNGYYVISSVNSGNVLDVQNGWVDPGTNVWQHESNNTDAQKWEIEENDDDTYSIISKKSGLYLDIQNGEMCTGANIQVFTGNGTKAQKFKLIKQENKTEKYVEDGTYKILTKLNDKIGFDMEGASKENGAILQIWTYEDIQQQQFSVKYQNGYYYIINVNSNKAIQVEGSNIIQYDINYSNENQKWILKNNGNYYSFISKVTGQSMYIPTATNGTDLKLNTYSENNNQLFKIEKIGIYIDESKYPGIKAKINELKSKYPKWEFEILYTGLNFCDVVNGEYTRKTNCLVDTTTYQGEWIAGNPYKSGVWYSASEKAIAYFMDTRNFLNDTDIFQFLDLNGYSTENVTINAISEQVKGTFLQKYATEINNACRNQNVNPYYVIARLFQEQGKKGTTIGTGMNGGDGKTYYNPFNIGAKLGNDYETALAKAKEKGWDSMEKAITGGIDFLKENWLENYQNTLYQNKFDIDTRNGTKLYSHEYMQNLSAAYSEARTLKSCYTEDNIKNSKFKFIIPVYENMPEEVSPRPSNRSSVSGPMDVQVQVNGNLNLRAEANTNSTVLKKLSNGTKLLSIKRAVNGNWNQVVTDDGKIGYVSGDYLQIIGDRTNCNIQKVVKTKDGIGIKIRIGPSIYVDQAGVLPDGTVVTTINTGFYNIDGYAWDRVILNDGRQVFAPAAYLK